MDKKEFAKHFEFLAGHEELHEQFRAMHDASEGKQMYSIPGSIHDDSAEKSWQQRLADYIEASTKRLADKLRREEFKTQYKVNVAVSALRQSITVASAFLSQGYAIPAEEHSVHEFGYRGTASREALEEAGLAVTYPEDDKSHIKEASEHSIMTLPIKDEVWKAHVTRRESILKNFPSELDSFIKNDGFFNPKHNLFNQDSLKIEHRKMYGNGVKHGDVIFTFDESGSTTSTPVKPGMNPIIATCGGCGQLGKTGGSDCVCDMDPYIPPVLAKPVQQVVPKCSTCGAPSITMCTCSIKTLANARKVQYDATTSAATVAKSSGMKCAGGCGEFNEYAEPNQANNTYICYRCRG